jgi:glycosyltransferase involved in cell wall biosynthesis
LPERLALGVAVARHVRRLGPFDAIEVPDWMALGWALSFVSGRACVVTHVHGPLVLVARQYRPNPPWHVRAAERLEQFATARADVVTSPSATTTRALEVAGWHTERWETVPCPVAVGEEPVPIPDAMNVAWCGRLDPLKDPSTLLAAVEHLRGLGVGPVTITLVYDSRATGSARLEQCRVEARERGLTVEFVANISREALHDIFGRARVVAVTSRFETFSMVAAEALASGRPVVCTTTCGIASSLVSGGAGRVFEAGDFVELARALAPYLTDLETATSTSHAARELAVRSFSSAEIARRRLHIYERCSQP